MRQDFIKAFNKAADGSQLTRADLTVLLQAQAGEEEAKLFELADAVRQKNFGNAVHLRGIIEFSNFCRNDCHYCGLRRSNRAIRRYRIPLPEIVATAKYAADLGYGTIVLQAGEDPAYSGEQLAEMIRQVKEAGDFAVTVCVGERSRRDYELMREAGADRYLLKHETADAALFAGLRPGTSLAERIKRLKWLRELGYQVGSGNMVGLPGQTVETLADDLLLLKELDVEMAGIGPFIPHHQTPLKDSPAGDLKQTLKTLAVARILLPQTHLPATTAIGTLHPAGRRMALACGANVIMPNLSPAGYRQLYQIYPEKAGSKENPEESHEKIARLVKEAGRYISTGRGDSPKEIFKKSPDTWAGER
ncbi:[FeFe] hydrogenase H-cluster radical SAM maturase HydE [Desulforamulus hydrothermalis]|uniref:Iron-only hydrogenase maturation protein HydE n=1 Tax=Desulforamulus hydrothermalis Lam5 = DSM 18033 TaxID=1121428 RepID=K8DWZ7_9FIRM|nr:[FeFe] hydrogenase H-cluster radical SAM maturase HydE [Desulforamulus hydrothermalis]CCO07004.1 Iron-only hydrogenase maturation protein HydE [Desulforamulus hydrothermalis Lam5 = DSM 18033]SHG97823.1 iron-only hydrogenase maturation protein HydE [Desulforamulus hydrothermalis Lam5 = DSM 18033]